MPAHTKRGLSKSRRRRNQRSILKRSKGLPKIGYLIFAIAALLTLFFSKSSFWNVSSKLAVAVNGENGPDLLIFDKELEEITRIHIPKDTETQVARQLGTWKIGSVWQLGENEKLDGKLLAESITFHLKFPVYVWADSAALGFVSGGPFSFLRAVVIPYKTNLSFADKLKIAQFALRVREFKKSEVELSETSAIQRIKLVDGSEGYRTTGQVPASILALFSDTDIAQKQTKAVIYDATEQYNLAQEVGEIVEAVGAKVTAIKKEEKGNYDCRIVGLDEKSVEKIALVLGCEKSSDKVSGNFDLEIYLGEEFSRRF